MTASVPKCVLLFESPLTARAGPYMYFYPGSGDTAMTAEERKLPSIGGQVVILLPAK